MFPRFTMPLLVIINNFKFKPIFLFATNVETTNVEMFDRKLCTMAFILEPFTATFALKLVSKLVNQVCHTSTTKKKTQDYEGIK
jgi:hypothetical protein